MFFDKTSLRKTSKGLQKESDSLSPKTIACFFAKNSSLIIKLSICFIKRMYPVLSKVEVFPKQKVGFYLVDVFICNTFVCK